MEGSLCSFHLQIGELMRCVIKQTGNDFGTGDVLYQGWGVRENGYKFLTVWHLLYINEREISIFFS